MFCFRWNSKKIIQFESFWMMPNWIRDGVLKSALDQPHSNPIHACSNSCFSIRRSSIQFLFKMRFQLIGIIGYFANGYEGKRLCPKSKVEPYRNILVLRNIPVLPNNGGKTDFYKKSWFHAPVFPCLSLIILLNQTSDSRLETKSPRIRQFPLYSYLRSGSNRVFQIVPFDIFWSLFH